MSIGSQFPIRILGAGMEAAAVCHRSSINPGNIVREAGPKEASKVICHLWNTRSETTQMACQVAAEPIGRSSLEARQKIGNTQGYRWMRVPYK